MTETAKLSVAICTLNRASLLDGALRSLSEADPPKRLLWEVIVVLNGCSDDSEAVAASYAAKLPMVICEEPRRGLSLARNRAIDAATGDVILWLDDDVRVGEHLLRRYEEAITGYPDAAVFGGAIVPMFDGGAPAWLSGSLPHLETAFAAKRPPPEGGAIDLASENLPFGANFAIRADAQRVHRYDPSLGKQPGMRMLNGEETEVIQAILRNGGAGRWVPEASVHHVIPVARQTPRYVYRYFLGNGWVEGRKLRQSEPPAGARAAGAELAAALASQMTFRWARLRRPATEWAPLLRRSAGLWGRWLGRYGPGGR